MIALRTTVVVGVLVVAGCGERTVTSVPTSHPANPDAVEAPLPPASQTLALPGMAPTGQVQPSGTTQPDATATPVRYTCRMHPQIVRDQPGKCPICNMTLVPKTAENKP